MQLCASVMLQLELSAHGLYLHRINVMRRAELTIADVLLIRAAKLGSKTLVGSNVQPPNECVRNDYVSAGFEQLVCTSEAQLTDTIVVLRIVHIHAVNHTPVVHLNDVRRYRA